MKAHYLYEQATGLLCGIDEEGLWYPIHQGYSGKAPFINNPDAESRKGYGPIPRGRYRICKPITHARLGPVAMLLAPYDETEMYGRGGFYIHGDNRNADRSASSGCIIMPRGVRDTIAEQTPIDLIVVRGVDIAEDAETLCNCQAPQETGAEQISGTG